MIQTIRAVRTHRELLLSFVRRELRVRYRRTALGWLWAFANPAILTVVYAFLFVVVFKASPRPGDPSGNRFFAFFFLSAQLPWGFLANGLNGGMSAVMSSASLFGRVAFPRQLVPVSAVLALLVSFLIELSVLIVIMLCFGFVAIPFIPVLLVLVVLLGLFVLGLTMMFSAANVRYRDVQHLVGVLLLVWFFLTPIMYGSEFVPDRKLVGGYSVPVRMILSINPMTRFTQAFRNCLFDLRLPSASTWLWCVVFAALSYGVGSTYYTKRARRFPEEM